MTVIFETESWGAVSAPPHRGLVGDRASHDRVGLEEVTLDEIAEVDAIPGEHGVGRVVGKAVADAVLHAVKRWPETPGFRWLRLTDDETADVVLAVDEAAANAVLHAYGPDESGAVELTLWTEPGPGVDDATLSIEVVDHGHWRPPDQPTVAGGRGIPLMSNVVESVLIHYDDRGSRVLLRHRLPVRD